MTSPQKVFRLASLMIAAATAGWFISQLLAPDAAQLQDAIQLPQPKTLPEFTLIDEHGDEFGRERFNNRWTLLFFGFTHCPDICPATLQMLATARQKMASNGNEVLPDILLISVDPERDTPELLKIYSEHFGDGVYAATGDIDELNILTSALGIYFARQEAVGGNYQVAHSAHVLLLDQGGRNSAVFSAPHTVEGFAHDIPILIAQK